MVGRSQSMRDGVKNSPRVSPSLGDPGSHQWSRSGSLKESKGLMRSMDALDEGVSNMDLGKQNQAGRRHRSLKVRRAQHPPDLSSSPEGKSAVWGHLGADTPTPMAARRKALVGPGPPIKPGTLTLDKAAPLPPLSPGPTHQGAPGPTHQGAPGQAVEVSVVSEDETDTDRERTSSCSQDLRRTNSCKTPGTRVRKMGVSLDVDDKTLNKSGLRRRSGEET